LSVLHWAFTYFVKNTVGIYVDYCIQKIKPSSQNAYMTGIINYSWGRVLAELLRKIFGRKRGMATADERRLHTEELHDLYSSPNKCSNK
jgi:hypothetical protein